jgi:hypothetical protein
VASSDERLRAIRLLATARVQCVESKFRARCGDLVGEVVHRERRRGHGRPKSGRDITLRQHRVTMSGNVGHGRGADEGLEHVRDAKMQGDPAAGGGDGDEGVTNDRMREAVLARARARVDDESPLERALEGVRVSVRVTTERRTDDVPSEHLAHDGGTGQDLDDDRAEPRDPADDGVACRGRQPLRGGMPEQLGDEERIPAGALPHVPSALPRRPGKVVGHRLDVVEGETLESDGLDDLRRVGRCDDRGQCVPWGDRLGTSRGDDEQARAIRPMEEMEQQLQPRRICPLGVVEDEHDGVRWRREQAVELLEQGVAFTSRVE